MRIENVDIDVILGTENKGIYGAHEKEKKGFFSEKCPNFIWTEWTKPNGGG